MGNLCEKKHNLFIEIYEEPNIEYEVTNKIFNENFCGYKLEEPLKFIRCEDRLYPKNNVIFSSELRLSFFHSPYTNKFLKVVEIYQEQILKDLGMKEDTHYGRIVLEINTDIDY